MKRKWRITGSVLAIIPAGVVLLWSGCTPLTPFEEIQARAGPEHFIEIDGHQVHVVRAGSGEPAIVLLHGAGASAYTFRDIIPPLAETRRVLAIDWYGFGWTERPAEPAAYTVSGQIAMIHAVLEKENIRRAHLFGHSFGALLANAYAETYPETVASLTLLSPPPTLGDTPWLMESRPGRALLYPLLRLFLSSETRFADMQRRSYAQPEKPTRQEMENYRQRLLVEGLWSALNGFFSGDKPAADTLRYGVDGIPLMILAGRQDPIVPLTQLEKLAQATPNTRFAVLEQSGHNAPEEQPRETVDLLETFYRDIQ
jgi:pimeloyl-ACP methyl ester carboxylesterase